MKKNNNVKKISIVIAVIVIIFIVQELIYIFPSKLDENGLFKELYSVDVSEEIASFKIGHTRFKINKDGTAGNKYNIDQNSSSIAVSRHCSGSIHTSNEITKVYITNSMYILSEQGEKGEILHFYGNNNDNSCFKELDYSNSDLEFNNIQLIDGKIVAEAKVVSNNDGYSSIKIAFTYNGELKAEVLE